MTARAPGVPAPLDSGDPEEGWAAGDALCAELGVRPARRASKAWCDRYVGDFMAWLQVALAENKVVDTMHMIYGKRGSGKSWLLRFLLYLMKDCWKEVHLFSPTAKYYLKEEWSMFPKVHIHNELNEHTVYKILREQDALHEAWQKEDDPKARAALEYHICLIWDDNGDNGMMRHSDLMNTLYMKGRHLWTTTFGLFQCVRGSGSVNPTARSNADFVYCRDFHSLEDMDKVADFYFGREGKELGKAVLRGLTDQPFKFAVAVLQGAQGHTYDLSKCLFTLQAPDKLPKYRLGSAAFWPDELYVEASRGAKPEISRLQTFYGVGGGMAMGMGNLGPPDEPLPTAIDDGDGAGWF